MQQKVFNKVKAWVKKKTITDQPTLEKLFIHKLITFLNLWTAKLVCHIAAKVLQTTLFLDDMWQ